MTSINTIKFNFFEGAMICDEDEIEIKNKDVIKNAKKLITWHKRAKEAKAVFGNHGIVAGFEPNEGFKIFLFSMADGGGEVIREPFLAKGLYEKDE